MSTFWQSKWRACGIRISLASAGVVVLCSICNEFEIIAERALREVATTEELMEMVDFIEEARTNGMRLLNQRVMVSERSVHLCSIINLNRGRADFLCGYYLGRGLSLLEPICLRMWKICSIRNYSSQVWSGYWMR